MRLTQFINEKRKNNVIVVDVQPMYKTALTFQPYEFIDFIMEQGKILYYYNGPDTVGSDTKEKIINWLVDYADDPDALYDKLTSKDVIWYDKGYGFFRAWMDFTNDDGRFLKKVIRWMAQKKVWDSREIEPEEWKEKFPDDWSDYMEYDPLIIPDIPLNTLKQFAGSYLIGGGKNECLREVEILMSAFNIKAKKVKKFIY